MPAVPRKLPHSSQNPERQLSSLQSFTTPAEDHNDNAVLSRVFESLKVLAADGSWLLGRCSKLEKTCKIEFASGELAELKGRALDISSAFYKDLISQQDSMRLASGAELRPALANTLVSAKLARGHIVICRIDLADGEHALVIQWRNQPIEVQRAHAIGLIAELATRASWSSDLSFEAEAQQVRFDSLRSEINEIQEFYREFSDAIRQCFWIVDLETGRPIVISENFERVWGASAKILEEGITGFMASVFQADHDRVLAEFHLNLEHEFDTELRVIAADGEVRWIWMRAFPSLKSGRRLVIIADDVTERKAQEENIRSREATLINHARAKAVSDVASGVAHEINNPLAIVVGRAAQIKIALQKPAIDVAAITDLADKIQTTSVRISKIVASLKSLSRQSKNAIFEDTSFERVFSEIRDLCLEKFKSGGVDLAIQEFEKSFRAHVNPTMVSQLLMNLLNNSYDAVLDLPEKWVRLEIYDDAQSIYVSVTDSGSGIPIKNRGRIFDPFFTTKSTGQGTGLGLALAVSIAAHHGGAISLDTLNPHTRFVAQFPKRQKT